MKTYKIIDKDGKVKDFIPVTAKQDTTQSEESFNSSDKTINEIENKISEVLEPVETPENTDKRNKSAVEKNK